MGRRSDHSREELRELFILEGRRQMAEVGFHRFSARRVADRIGYSVGTLYNVFGTLDSLIISINTRTFTDWTHYVQAALDHSESDRIAALVYAYFSFAESHPQLWMAIYDHRLPPGVEIPETERAERAKLSGIVAQEVSAALGRPIDDDVIALTRSLIATVHGHCALFLSGSLALMGEMQPAARALDRVRDSLRIARSDAGGRADHLDAILEGG